MDMHTKITAKGLIGKQFDKSQVDGEYEFAMYLGELLTEPTGEDDITAEAFDFPIFFARSEVKGGDAWASVEYIINNIQYIT